MHQIAQIIQKANDNHTKLPTMSTLIQRLHERAASLENAVSQAQNEKEETLINTEARRIREVINLVKTEPTIIEAAQHLKEDMYQAEQQIISFTSAQEKVPHALQVNYDLAVYHYNEYYNAVDSLV